MKRFTQILCLVLILSLVLAMPAYAAEITPRGSDYFHMRSCYLWEVSSTEFQVWFDVTAVDGMDRLGVETIKVQRSTDGTNWTTVKTYDMDDYPSMTAYNTGTHDGCVTYSNRQAGYSYRAYVLFYAKNSAGTAVYRSYTSSI